MTPDEVRGQINSLLIESLKAPDWVSRFELEADRAEEAADRAYDLALLESTGNVEERKALARRASSDERDAAFVAKAALTRVKLKARQLEQSIVANQALLKSLHLDGA